MFSHTKAVRGVSGAIVVASLVMPLPAQAGFFDQIFGGGQPAPQPSYGYEPQERLDDLAFPPTRARPAKKVVVDEKPVLQNPTDLMHDKTLRPGDAVMMKSGMHIYTGREASVHRNGDFTPLDQARNVKASEKVMLAGLDATRNDPLARAKAPDTLASGRSAAVASPVVAGVKFTDARGRIIRYVGP